jgi:bifunctional N-acetylglucosamine-1-phosphate-uridyltransferase/glucosamine-1-phosphate-acetyltransferase GlmU-like protein
MTSGFPFPRLRTEALLRASTSMTAFYDVINSSLTQIIKINQKDYRGNEPPAGQKKT